MTRATRASAAWAGLALSTSLIGMMAVGAQPQTSGANGSNLNTTAMQISFTYDPGDVTTDESRVIVGAVSANLPLVTQRMDRGQSEPMLGTGPGSTHLHPIR